MFFILKFSTNYMKRFKTSVVFSNNRRALYVSHVLHCLSKPLRDFVETDVTYKISAKLPGHAFMI